MSLFGSPRTGRRRWSSRPVRLDDLGPHAVDFHELSGDAAGKGLGVNLGLDRDTVGDGVQAAGEAEQ